MSRDDNDSDTLLAQVANTARRHVPLHLVGTKRFELRKKLGSGAFGDVYEARDREYGNLVALKTLKTSHPDWIYRFKREFRIVGDLAHPNLVRMFELFLEDDRWYLTMELIDGRHFDEHLRLAPDTLRSCFGQLALGLSELHGAGCLHRDVKPSNALVESTGQVVLLDFGLAVSQHAAVASAVAGTAPYMAPELGHHHPATEASDWYSFGVMLYEALAGERPFAGDHAEMLRAKLREPPPAPSEIRTGVDPALESLALRLLAKDPATRPSAAEVLSALAMRVSAGSARGVAGPIVGRQHERAALDAAFEASRHRLVAVSVSGPAGIGKTALVEAFIDDLRSRREAVYRGRCLELESVPLKGLDAAIDELCNDLSRSRLPAVGQFAPSDVSALVHVFPMVKRVAGLDEVRAREPDDRDPRDLREAAVRVLRGLFEGLGPVVLFIDDLHWAGDDTVALLLELLASPAPSMLVIVAHRGSGDLRDPIVDRFGVALARQGTSLVELEVPALDPASVGAWITTRGTASMSADHLVRETGGHPYLLSRLFLHASFVTDRPIRLADVLESALVELDAKERELLDAVAIAGRPTLADALFQIVGAPRDPALVDQLRRHKLIQTSVGTQGTTFDTFHARVREAVLAAMPLDRRRDLEVKLASVLAALANPVGS